MLNCCVRRTALILGLGLILSISIYDRTSRDSGRVVNNIILTSDADSNQQIHAGAGDDVVYVRGGQDEIRGEEGVYASGHGSDVIDDIVNMSNEIDTLRLTDLTASDVMLLRDAAKLMVIVKPTGEVITVEKQFLAEGHWGIEKIEFSDGMSWDRDKILMR
ncbi:calcium-binding protein [Rhizobium aouanii]|uniref:Calcium-binding protein n=1 Tax=Rhizobium aouanii TaxID=3118145 RepID=A0ABU8CL18_9HYPH